MCYTVFIGFCGLTTPPEVFFLELMNERSDLFGMVKEYCHRLMPESPYSIWISELECTHLDHTSATIQTKNEAYRMVLETRYKDMLGQAFEAVLGFPVEITFTAPPSQERADEVDEPVPGKIGDYEYTFDTFIVGSSNKFAYAASLAVASNPNSEYNPLFIYGNSGLGKTHLLCAISAFIEKNRPGANIIYVKGEDFTNELINALENHKMKDFHDKYRQADILLMDDIQFISGKESTQEEFFHTFNTLYESGKQIVVTSDRPPKDMKTLEDRLRTRFELSMIADVQPPDYETRVAIIRRKAELLKIELPEDVIDFIANRLKTNIRQLEGTVKKIKAYNDMVHIPPSISVAQNSIRDILNDSQPVSVTIEHIIDEVSRYYEVSAQDVRGPRRTSQISSARQVSIYIVREITGMSMEAIGAEFGGRDHSTIVYALKQVEKMMAQNPHYKGIVEDLIKNINAK